MDIDQDARRALKRGLDRAGRAIAAACIVEPVVLPKRDEREEVHTLEELVSPITTDSRPDIVESKPSSALQSAADSRALSQSVVVSRVESSSRRDQPPGKE